MLKIILPLLLLAFPLSSKEYVFHCITYDPYDHTFTAIIENLELKKFNVYCANYKWIGKDWTNMSEEDFVNFHKPLNIDTAKFLSPKIPFINVDNYGF